MRQIVLKKVAYIGIYLCLWPITSYIEESVVYVRPTNQGTIQNVRSLIGESVDCCNIIAATGHRTVGIRRRVWVDTNDVGNLEFYEHQVSDRLWENTNWTSGSFPGHNRVGFLKNSKLRVSEYDPANGVEC